MKNIFLLVSSVTLITACSIGPSANRPVAPDQIVADVVSGSNTIIGRYDPVGFTTEEARTIASFSCDKETLASYSESVVDGQIVFEATCSD